MSNTIITEHEDKLLKMAEDLFLIYLDILKDNLKGGGDWELNIKAIRGIAEDLECLEASFTDEENYSPDERGEWAIRTIKSIQREIEEWMF